MKASHKSFGQNFDFKALRVIHVYSAIKKNPGLMVLFFLFLNRLTVLPSCFGIIPMTGESLGLTQEKEGACMR